MTVQNPTWSCKRLCNGDAGRFRPPAADRSPPSIPSRLWPAFCLCLSVKVVVLCVVLRACFLEKTRNLRGLLRVDECFVAHSLSLLNSVWCVWTCPSRATHSRGRVYGCEESGSCDCPRAGPVRTRVLVSVGKSLAWDRLLGRSAVPAAAWCPRPAPVPQPAPPLARPALHRGGCGSCVPALMVLPHVGSVCDRCSLEALKQSHCTRHSMPKSTSPATRGLWLACSWGRTVSRAHGSRAGVVPAHGRH